MKSLSAKLLLFESRLIRKQKDISTMLNHRENIIHRQQRFIELLTSRLADNGLEPPQSELTELDTNLMDLDSLNDSDSAVVMEDIDSDTVYTHIPKFRSGNSDSVTVVRSISDAIDPNLKYTIRRSNGFLRRPEILETVYSVEEDGDNDGQMSDTKSEANKRRDAFASGSGKAICNLPDNTNDDASLLNIHQYKDRQLEEKICEIPNWPYKQENQQDESTNSNEHDVTQNKTTKNNNNNNNQVTTYNRVMSNHRSVTKPKDVKYKRINKAKSKSLEELRGRLKNWVEQGTKLGNLTLEHSQSYA